MTMAALRPHGAAQSMNQYSRGITPATEGIRARGVYRLAPAFRSRTVAIADVEGPSTSYAASSLVNVHRNSRQSVVVAASSSELPRTAGTGKVGVVIVDHGSRKKASNDMLVEFGQLYGSLTGEEIVEIAHMELASPTIEEAVGRCAARGASTVVIAPYFLSRGRHIQQDIPALVRQAAAQHPGLSCVIAEPIGIDPLMVQLISNRVAATLQVTESAAAAATSVAAVEEAGAVATGAATATAAHSS